MKTVVIYHSVDMDGQMSAAIVKHWFKKQYPNSCYYNVNTQEAAITPPDIEWSGNSLDFIGYNYGQPIPDLSEYDKVIMCDISFPIEEMEKLAYKLMGNFIWIDHHISAINSWKEGLVSPNGLRDTKFAACELTWKYFFPSETMPEIVRLLGLYDSFRHKNTDEETKVLEFQYGARSAISNYEEAYKYLLKVIDDETNGNYSTFPVTRKTINEIHNHGTAIYKYLCTEAKQVYKNGFEIYFEPEYIPRRRKFICINKERFNPINFGIDYHKDGYDGAACFHYANGMWNFSIYSDNELVNCSVIAKQYSGGGHFNASGFKLNNEQFLQLIKQ